MGTTSSTTEKDAEKEKKREEFEEAHGWNRTLLRSASFDDDQPMLEKGTGIDSSHGTLRRVYVTIPKGVRTGQYFTVHVNGQDLEVRCPPAYSRISDRVVVELPADSNPASLAQKLPAPPVPISKVNTGRTDSEKASDCDQETASTKPLRFYVTVPKGARTGKYFPVHMGGQHFMVKCPPAYSRISDRIIVEVPHDAPFGPGTDRNNEPAVYRIDDKAGEGMRSQGGEGGGATHEVQSDTGQAPAPVQHSGNRPRGNSNPEIGTRPTQHMPGVGSNDTVRVDRIYVRIPPGTRSGQFFTVHVRGHDIKVRCPPAYSRISDRVLVEVPAASDSTQSGESNPPLPPESPLPTSLLPLSAGAGVSLDENVLSSSCSLEPRGRAAKSVQSAPDVVVNEGSGGKNKAAGADVASVLFGSSASIISGIDKKTGKKSHKLKGELLKDSE